MATGLRTPATASPHGVGPLESHPGIFARLTSGQHSATAVARRGLTLVWEAELRARTDAWRTAFAHVRSSAIALFEPDGVEFAAALMGAWYAGKTVYLPGDARHATCAALATHDVAFAGVFDDEWHPIRASEPGNSSAQFSAIDPDSAQLVIYTSGSTGAPQALPKRLSQLLAEVDALESIFGEQLGNCEVLATVSHQHIYGLLFKILLPLATRRTFVSLSVAYPEEMVSHLIERATAIVSGPAHLKRLPENLDWAQARTHATAVFSSGGPLSLDAAISVENFLGTAPIEVYGSSETGGVAWRQRTNGVDQSWTPLPGVRVRQDENEHCLAVQSRHLANEDWYVVADRVEFDDDGRFNLFGRVDRIAKIEGKRVSLVAVEQCIMRTNLVSDVRVVLLDTGRDELGAVVVPNDAGWEVMRNESPDALRNRLQTAVTESADRIARPRRWRWLDALPANAVGKATHDELVALFAPRALTVPAVHQLSRTAERGTFELYVSPHLLCFDGHFAALPVLPGIAQLTWAIELGVPLFGITRDFERLEAIKFQRLYRPGRLLSLELEWNSERHMLVFRYVSNEGPHSSGRIFFTR